MCIRDGVRADHEKQHDHRLEDGRILKLSDEFADKLAEFEDVMDIDAREACLLYTSLWPKRRSET